MKGKIKADKRNFFEYLEILFCQTIATADHSHGRRKTTRAQQRMNAQAKSELLHCFSIHFHKTQYQIMRGT